MGYKKRYGRKKSYGFKKSRGKGRRGKRVRKYGISRGGYKF